MNRMNRRKGTGFIIKSITNSNIWKTFKLLCNGDVGIIILMVLAGICHKLRDIYLFLENGSIFLVLLGVFSLVVVEGRSLLSSWNKSSKRRRFLTLGNIIALAFMATLLPAGAYSAFIIFKVRDLLTINFLGIFGIIWTFRWIQKLKDFSSTKNSPYKLTGPFIAIIILISGYAMHSKNTMSGPVSCILAPTIMWVFSLVFGDIKGRSGNQYDRINIFAIIASTTLFILAIYAILNPKMYGIEVMDAEFFKDLCDTIQMNELSIDYYTKRLQEIPSEIESCKSMMSSSSTEYDSTNPIQQRIMDLEESITLNQKCLMRIFQPKINLRSKFIENPGLIKSTVEDLKELRDTYAKPRFLKVIEDTIMSWFRRGTLMNAEEIATD